MIMNKYMYLDVTQNTYYKIPEDSVQNLNNCS